MWTFRPIPSVFRLVSVIGFGVLLCGCKEDLFGVPSIETDLESIEFRWDGTVVGVEESHYYSLEATKASLRIYIHNTLASSYTYSCPAEWVHISEDLSSSRKLTVETDFNTQKEAREATISLVAGPNVRGEWGDQAVRIVQQGFDPSTLISPSSLTLAADDTKAHSITINYSGRIDLSSDDESAGWLYYPTYGSGSKTQTVTIRATQPNLSGNPRQGTITLTLSRSGTDEKYTAALSVTQQGSTHGFLEESVIELASDAVADRLVAVNYTGSWRATSNASWLKAGLKYSDGRYRLGLTADANPSIQPREATVTVSTTDLSSGSQYTATIRVTQQGAPDDIAPRIDNPVLRSALAEQCGAQGGEVLRSRLETLTSLDLSAAAGESIGSIDWILAYCPNLQELTCKGLALTRLDLNSLKGLKSLDCSGNRLTSLYNLPAGLTELNCSGNSLSSIPIQNLSELTFLDCSHNDVKYSYDLNLGTAPLETLDCSYNQLTILSIGSTYNYLLRQLNCSHNNLSGSLILSSLRQLEKLDCSGNRLNYVRVYSTATLEYTKDSATQIY